MYKIIPAQPIHIKKIIHYLSITCFWKEFIEENSLNLSYDDFMSEWIVIPRLSYTKVLVDVNNEEKIYGCIVTATSKDFANMPDYTPYLHPRVIEVFNPWFQFPIEDSVILELFALSKDLIGNGYGSQLYEVAENLALQKGKDLSAFVWNCFPNSLITLTRKGWMIKDCIAFELPINIKLLYLEKKSENIELKDYFQSETYINLKKMLIK